MTKDTLNERVRQLVDQVGFADLVDALEDIALEKYTSLAPKDRLEAVAYMVLATRLSQPRIYCKNMGL